MSDTCPPCNHNCNQGRRCPARKKTMPSPTDLAAALLRDVLIRGRIYTGGNCLDELVCKKDVLAALTAALDAPERIFVDNYRETPEGRVGVWGEAKHVNGGTPYIRADLAPDPALRAELDWWEQDARAAWDKCEERRIAQEAAEAEVSALTARLEGLTGAAKRVLDPLDEPCRHDHHGYCQAHFIEAECSVAALRAALSTTEASHE